MKNLFIAIYFLIVIQLTFQACEIRPNQRMLIEDAPVLVKQVQNGQKFIIGDLNDTDGNYLYIAKLKGTPYEMGKAFGALYKEQISANIKGFYDFYLDQLYEILANSRIPIFVAKGLTNSVHSLALGLLDINIMITKRYTNSRYYQQIAGIAAGAKMKGKDISRLNIFPQIIKAACTVAGVWKGASLNNHTLHIRSLDWDAKNPISKYPLITVYHPSDPKLNMHANIGWAGFVGSLTGVSPYLSLGQKVWYPKQGTVKMTRYGNPWTYVIRDVLYEAHNIRTALSVLSTTHRTCAIHLGLGSAEDHSFRMFQYAENVLNNYNDKNYTHYDPNSHPQKEGIAYFDKFVQPSHNDCVGSLLTNPNIYGQWELESLWRIIGMSHETGDTQHVVFDLEDQKMMISYSRVYKNSKNETIEQKAFGRSPFLIDLKSLWRNF